jgi:hypothetical protein
VLNTTSFSEERITTAHRAKLLYVYVRQSSPGQVRHHQESTQVQYRLVERAVILGWPRERVHGIDDDLGKSGAPPANPVLPLLYFEDESGRYMDSHPWCSLPCPRPCCPQFHDRSE